MVEPTHLKNMLVKLNNVPNYVEVKIKKCFKPPPSVDSQPSKTNHPIACLEWFYHVQTVKHVKAIFQKKTLHLLSSYTRLSNWNIPKWSKFLQIQMIQLI